MTPPYVLLYKEVGQTPLDAITAWKEAHPEYADMPASYAGRLDPMAEGMLLVLLGDECKRQEKYRGLDKEYEIEIVLDLVTDTGDVLGMPAYAGRETSPSSGELTRVLKQETGTKEVPYPAFSSKTVHGKPLFMYALEGTLNTIEIPRHPETVYRIEQKSVSIIEAKELHERIERMLAKAPRSDEPSKVLGADFRQDEIKGAWTALFEELPPRSFTVLTLRVTCASGTYMRTLAERIGYALGTSALCLSIKRTRIGTYKHGLGMGMWTRKL
jgi:tRNA pseudouridine(55) synthase